ncbi:MAG: HEPN domain-containing protein [Thermoguttaceae bacterium]|jgi:HEPN domain-containing protein
MKDDRDVALGWLRKADSDLANAELCLSAEKSLDTACFHCQQAAEKSLKAYLIANKTEFPFIHDLKRLLDVCSQLDSAFDAFTADALRLTPYAVATRYDDAFWPDLEEVQEALDSARAIRRFVQERFS